MNFDTYDLRAAPRHIDHHRVALVDAKVDRDIATLLGMHLPKASVKQRALAHVTILDAIVAASKGKL